MTIFDLKLDRSRPEAAYRQIYRSLREAILSGALPSGTRLPAGRRLADEADVARITVSRAYDQLAAEGLVERRVGSGTFVSGELPKDDAISVHNKPARFSPELTDWGRQVLSLASATERGV